MAKRSFCIFGIIRQSVTVASQNKNYSVQNSWVCMPCPAVMTVHSISEQQHVYTPALIITRVCIPLHCYIKFPGQRPLPSQQISDGKIDSTTAQGSSHVGFWLASTFLSYYVPKVSLYWHIFLLPLVTHVIHNFSLQWHEGVPLTHLWHPHCTIIIWLLIFLVVCASWPAGYIIFRPTCGNV